MFQLLLIKAIYRSPTSDELLATLYKEVELPFCPYSGLCVSIGLKPTTVHAEDFVWNAKGRYFRCDVQADFLETISDIPTMQEVLAIQNADGWKRIDDDVVARYF